MYHSILCFNHEFFASSHIKYQKVFDFSCNYQQAFFQHILTNSSVITVDIKKEKKYKKQNFFIDDGLYSLLDSPLTSKVVKPYLFNDQTVFCQLEKPRCKILEIAIREVYILPNQNFNKPPPEINSLAVLYKNEIIYKTSLPFNRKLHKLHLKNVLDLNNLIIKVQASGDLWSKLPLPLPRRSVKNKKIEIDFSIKDHNGLIYSGLVILTISLNIDRVYIKHDPLIYVHTPSINDPNDPRNNDTLIILKKNNHQKQVNYFLLHNPVLYFSTFSSHTFQMNVIRKKRISTSLNIAVIEQLISLTDISFGNQIQVNKTLRSFDISNSPKHCFGRKQTLTLTILKGVEIPVREESALVEPVIEVEWENIICTTKSSDGPAPIWQETLEFEIQTAKMREHFIKIRLFDNHPIWGLQWLGEATVPVEFHQNNQLERWVELSPVYSPVLTFGYVQAAPGYSYTRIYFLINMKQMTTTNPIYESSFNQLSTAIQQYLSVPYKIADVKTSEDAQNLVMLLDSLPGCYGPVSPKQALTLNKVDNFGRSTLLANLLKGLGITSYVLLGSTLSRLRDSFVLTISKRSEVFLWDAKNGNHYQLNNVDRCPLINVTRLIDGYSIWDNIKKSASPVNLNYDTKTSKDWKLFLSTSSSNPNMQIVDIDIKSEKSQEEIMVAQEIEKNLRENFIKWRTALEIPTSFNRHSDIILHEILEKTINSNQSVPEKKELRQLYSAYYTHGFIVNVTYTNLKDLSNFFQSTKIHAVTGPVEFSLVCQVKKMVGKIRSIWIAAVVLRNKS